MCQRSHSVLQLLRACVLVICAWQAPAGAAPESLDVRLLVDVSSQMKRLDPDDQRARATGMLVHLLPKTASAGVWTYARYVNMLVKHGPTLPAWVEAAARQTADLPAVGTDANLLAAVEAATWDLDALVAAGIDPAASPEMATRHIIILGDGRLQTGSGEEADRRAREALLEVRLPALIAAGFRIHGLQLPGSEAGSDGRLLQQMATASGGLYLPVANLEALSAAFMKVFQVTARPQSVPLRHGGFQVDPGIDEITVLRPRTSADEDLRLIDPDGGILTRARLREGVRWHDAGRYDMVTVERPIPGRWHFSHPIPAGARVFVAGDLEVRLQGVPATVFPGVLKTFELQLRNAGALITDRDFLALLNIRASIQAAAEQIPVIVEEQEPGRYLLKLLALEEQGEHQVEVHVSGPTFERVLRTAFIVRNPVSVQIVPAAEGELAWLELNAANVNYATLIVSAQSRRPPAAGKTLEVQRLPTGLWKLRLPEGRGALELTVKVEGNYLNGSPFKLHTDPIVLSTPLRAPMEVNLDLTGAKLAGSAVSGAGRLVPDAAANPFLPGAGVAAPSAATQQARNRVDPAQEADLEVVKEDPEQIPLWFAGVLGVLNLVIGLSVWVLLKVPEPAEAFHAEVAALQALFTPAADDLTEADTAAAAA